MNTYNNMALEAYNAKFKKNADHLEVIRSSLSNFEKDLIQSIHLSTKPIFFVKLKYTSELGIYYTRDKYKEVVEKILPEFIPEGFILDCLEDDKAFGTLTHYAKILPKD